MKIFLHVGCGPKHKDRTTAGFNTPDWQEQRLDIDESVSPDIVGTMTDLEKVLQAAEAGPRPAVELVSALPGNRQPTVFRALAWLMKLGVLRLCP